MKRWEYRTIQLLKAGVQSIEENHQYWMNLLGAEGWECIGIVDRGEAMAHFLAYFKREIFIKKPGD